LNYATDAWTSPNHKAYVAFTVHFAHEGTPISMLLDLVEVARSHSGANLAAAFAKVLEEFGISDKVLLQLNKRKKNLTFFPPDSWCHSRQRIQQRQNDPTPGRPY
jgi:hypothetical protein